MGIVAAPVPQNLEGRIVTATKSTLAQRISQLQVDLSEQIPDEALAAFRAEQTALYAAGVPRDAAGPGENLPDVQLLDVHGNSVSLSQIHGRRPAVVVLYRGGWCPYCNLTLRAYQGGLVPELDTRGVQLIAISPQKVDGSMLMQQKNELTFTVLSDPGNQVADAWGVLTEISREIRSVQRSLGLYVAGLNDDGKHILPMPTVAVIDAAGVIRWIDVHPNYAARSEVDAIVEAVGLVAEESSAAPQVRSSR